MANKTIQELRDFVTQQMPSNSELLVKPFRTFFFYLLDRLADIPDATGFNELLQKIFGTTDIGTVNYQTIFGNDFQGTNLISYLLYLRSTKADLVDGKIPISQIPDMASFYRVGNIITTPSTVEMKLRVNEFNVTSPNLLSVNGQVRTEATPSLFMYTPVTEGKIKIVTIYGIIEPVEVDQEKVFYLAEGVEGIEGTEPELPEGAFKIRSITVTSETQIPGGEEELAYKVTSEDGWKNVVINSDDPMLIQMGGYPGGTFRLYVNPGITTPTLKGFTSKLNKNMWDGRMILLHNESDQNIAVQNTLPIPNSGQVTYHTYMDDYSIEPNEYVWIKVDGRRIRVIPNSSSGTLPVGGGEWDFNPEDMEAPEIPDDTDQ